MNACYITRISIGLLAIPLIGAGLFGCAPTEGANALTEAQQAEMRQGQSRPTHSDAVMPIRSGASGSDSADRSSAGRMMRVTVQEGTRVHMRLSSQVGSGISQVGDTASGTTTVAIVVGDRVAIPIGSTIHCQVTEVRPAKKGLKVAEKGGAIVLAFTTITTPSGFTSPLSGSLTSVANSKGKTAGIIAGSAAGGAILGKILGGDSKDAAIGAVVGGGIGTGIAAGTKGKEVTIPAGTELAITLDQPLTISLRV